MTRVTCAQAVTTLSTLGLLATLTTASPAKATYLSIGDKDTSPKAKINPLLTTFGNPDDYIVSPPSAFDGVVDVLTQEIADPTLSSFCSGSLLTTGRHILTAAHCLTDDSGNLNATNGTVRFELDTGNVIVPIANYFIHPDWQGDFLGGDIAILELDAIAPETAQRYDIYRDTNEVFQVGTKVGYGSTGNGNEGEVSFDLAKRSGKNRYDSVGDIFESVTPGALLAYDFDNGLTENDAFGFFFGINDLGLGEEEVLAASGDSGGPTFIDGAIAGVTSFTLGSFFPVDIDPFNNRSFGEFGFDTRVSTYASWVDGILSPQTVPESTTMLSSFLIVGLGFLSSKQKKN
jgi:secreted trypsin-like serine protease